VRAALIIAVHPTPLLVPTVATGAALDGSAAAPDFHLALTVSSTCVAAEPASYVDQARRLRRRDYAHRADHCCVPGDRLRLLRGLAAVLARAGPRAPVIAVGNAAPTNRGHRRGCSSTRPRPLSLGSGRIPARLRPCFRDAGQRTAEMAGIEPQGTCPARLPGRYRIGPD